MKYIIIILAALLGAFNLQAQELNFSNDALVPSYRLEIGWHKTTMLIFPSAIEIGQRGDGPVLAEKVKGVENVLIVKAGQKNFVQSNLQVITRDGKVFSFIVSYTENPVEPTVDLRKQKVFAPVTFKGLSLNEKEISDYAALVADSKPVGKIKSSSHYGLSFTLQGVYIREDLLFIRFQLKNHTPIRYDAASLRFYIRDKKKAKRTAEQDNESVPLFMHHAGVPEDSGGQTLIAVFPKFTITEKKYFVAELMEENGDRNAQLKIRQGMLLRARPIMK